MFLNRCFTSPALILNTLVTLEYGGFFLEIEGSDSETETPIRIFENDDGCDDNDMIDGIEADLEIETGTKMCLVL